MKPIAVGKLPSDETKWVQLPGALDPLQSMEEIFCSLFLLRESLSGLVGLINQINYVA